MMNIMTAGEMLAFDDNSSDETEGLTRIGDMARTFGVTLRALRFYEDKGLLSPRREGLTRLYTRRDRTRLRLILLGRRIGFSLRDVKQIIDLYEPNGSNVRQLKLVLEKGERQRKRLEQQRAQVDEAEAELDALLGQVRSHIADKQPA